MLARVARTIRKLMHRFAHKSARVQASWVTYGALRNAEAPLTTPTYDGSGQAMHPSVLYIPSGWHGYKYWMAVTPYPYYDANYENPSVLVSADGLHWVVPQGALNPIAADSPNLADAELVLTSDRKELWLFYISKRPGAVRLMRTFSGDGINWSVPEIVIEEARNGVISPSITFVNDSYHLWYVNAVQGGWKAQHSHVEMRTSKDGKSWSAPVKVTAHLKGKVIWHVQITDIPQMEQQWMVAAAYPYGKSSGRTELYFGWSNDILHWHFYQKPLLRRGKGWDGGQIYRSAVLYDAPTDTLRLWYSARRGAIWRTGYTSGTFAEIKAELER
jgi:hypothetical protein